MPDLNPSLSPRLRGSRVPAHRRVGLLLLGLRLVPPPTPGPGDVRRAPRPTRLTVVPCYLPRRLARGGFGLLTCAASEQAFESGKHHACSFLALTRSYPLYEVHDPACILLPAPPGFIPGQELGGAVWSSPCSRPHLPGLPRWGVGWWGCPVPVQPCSVGTGVEWKPELLSDVTGS